MGKMLTGQIQCKREGEGAYGRAIALTLLALVLTLPQTACAKDKLRTIAKAEQDVAEGIKSAAKLVREAETSGELSDQDAREFRGPLEDLAAANDIAIKTACQELANQQLSAVGQTRILAELALASDALVRLNNAAVLHIKNPRQREAFNVLIIALQGAIASVVVVLSK